MVKIVNPLGDVKIGKQGEVVYQRKYGEQIRRQVSPKRAIPSQTQIDHRQLYRAALAWRKQLSLANRRYLEGYCIANWIVDRYKIPLAWSRFALKLYLQAVRFALIEKAIPGGEGEAEKKQSYDATPSWNVIFRGNLWKAETFLTTDGYTITSVKVKLCRESGTGSEVTVSIRDTEYNRPTGEDLTSGTTDGTTLDIQPNWEMREIELTPYDLLPDHQYAIVIRAAGTETGEGAVWAGRNSEPLYPDGRHCLSDNSGESWSAYSGNDNMFETWAVVAGTPPVLGLIHVRHPALMSIVHKRGELTIKEYDTLSSLDDEYLTKQVGLDVEKGDVIKATTLPGLEYPYEVS